MRAFYTVVFKTALGRLCITDHCKHAVGEMQSLAESLERLLALDEMPGAAHSYRALKGMMPSWAELSVDPCYRE